MKKYKFIKNPQELSTKLNNIIKEIYETGNPEEITEYKKFFSKHVSIFSRKYVSAYLIQKYILNSTEQFNSQQRRKLPNEHNHLKNHKNQEQKNNNNTSFFKKNQQNLNQSHANNNNNNNTSQSQRTVRYSLSIGREDTTSEELKQFLTSSTSVLENNIMNIKVLHRNSLVYITTNKPYNFINDIKGKEFKGKAIKIISHFSSSKKNR